MTTTIAALLLLAAGSYAFKLSGPMLAAGRELPPTLARASDLLPAAMLAALVATQTIGGDAGAWALDARIVGVGAAGIAVWRDAPFAVVVLVGTAVTAVVRALGWG